MLPQAALQGESGGDGIGGPMGLSSAIEGTSIAGRTRKRRAAFRPVSNPELDPDWETKKAKAEKILKLGAKAAEDGDAADA